MDFLPITSIIAATLALIMFVLTLMVSLARINLGKAEGDIAKYPTDDGNNESLKRRIATFRNFTEYVPMSLIMLALIENNGASSTLVCGLGIAFIIGRLLHATGMLINPHFPFPRIIGMFATYAILLVPAVWLLTI